MESTGERNKIQVSQATADALTKAGKSHWLTARSDVVKAKGKGVLQTFWVDPTRTPDDNGSSGGSDVSDSNHLRSDGSVEIIHDLGPLIPTTNDARNTRLVEWMVEMLLVHIKKIVSYQAPISLCVGAWLAHLHFAVFS
jgi:hypothetical protein